MSSSGGSTSTLSEESDEIGITAEGGDDLLDEAKSLTLILETKVSRDSIRSGKPSKDTKTIIRCDHNNAAAVCNQHSVVQD